VALGILIGVAIVSLLQKNISRGIRIGTAVFVCAVLACVWFLASKDLHVRYKAIDFTEMGGRADIYKNAPQMAKDFPVFGTGPGSFQSVYHLYRTDPGDLWHGFLHDDWLETRITFGWVGFGLILANFLVLAIWIMMPGRFPVPRAFTWCALAGLVGTMVHAKFDFPFQTYSIYFTFVVVAAVLCSVSPERR
jgi:O-antigen ligase